MEIINMTSMTSMTGISTQLRVCELSGICCHNCHTRHTFWFKGSFNTKEVIKQ